MPCNTVILPEVGKGFPSMKSVDSHLYLCTQMYGTCCTEMDVWESNMMSTAVTPHTCTCTGQTRCTGVQCGDDASGDRENGVCDKDGSDFNPFRLGDKNFFGPGANFSVDSSQPFTVVTQWYRFRTQNVVLVYICVILRFAHGGTRSSIHTLRCTWLRMLHGGLCDLFARCVGPRRTTPTQGTLSRFVGTMYRMGKPSQRAPCR